MSVITNILHKSLNSVFPITGTGPRHYSLQQVTSIVLSQLYQACSPLTSRVHHTITPTERNLDTRQVKRSPGLHSLIISKYKNIKYFVCTSQSLRAISAALTTATEPRARHKSAQQVMSVVPSHLFNIGGICRVPGTLKHYT